MKLTKCENRHFFDADKNSSCPHCERTGIAKPKVEDASDTVGFCRNCGCIVPLTLAGGNEQIQDLHLNDAEYGLISNKPIFVAGFGEHETYLQRLVTHYNGRISYKRLGSELVPGISGPVDMYEIRTESGEFLKKIYLSNYGTKTSEKMPSGLWPEQVNTSLCSHCGAKTVENAVFCAMCGSKLTDNARCNYCFEAYDMKLDTCLSCGYRKGDRAKELHHLCPGTILHNRYTVGQVLGHGGFGITYMAWDKRHNIIMAIKEYYPSDLVNRVPGTQNVLLFTGSRQKEYDHGLMRFLDEARKMEQFSNHQNMNQVYACFEENNTAYIVVEYLDGITLSDFIKQNSINVKRAVEIIAHVCTALKAIHQANFVHRGVNPNEIFLCADGAVKLLASGAMLFPSDAEQEVPIIIWPGFSPPEQYERAGTQDSQTDIYAVGATLYYMLMGVKPEESVNRMIEDTLVAPQEIDASIPKQIGNTIMKAMALDKRLRYNSISEFERDLQQEPTISWWDLFKKPGG